MHIMSIDCESNGLHGTIFAIGAVIIDADDPDKLYNSISEFSGMVDIRLQEELDPWVIENVLPVSADLDLYDSLREMRGEFWSWYIEHNKPLTEQTIILADFGVPVEARLFRECIAENPVFRGWSGPYPLHDLGTMLLMVGADPDKTNRRTWWHDLYEDAMFIEPGLRQHDPVDDALGAARCAVKALRMARAAHPIR